MSGYHRYDLNVGGAQHSVLNFKFFSPFYLRTPTPPHPWHSNINDLNYGGWLVISHSTPPTTPPPKFKSYLWYPDIYVWVSGVGWWGGSIKMGKKIYRFKTECWAQDVGCADVKKFSAFERVFCQLLLRHIPRIICMPWVMNTSRYICSCIGNKLHDPSLVEPSPQLVALG